MTRRAAVAAIVVAAVVAGAVVGVVRARRAHEWAHGGETMDASAEVAVVEYDGVAAAVERLGGPGGVQSPLGEDRQAVVVRLRWSAPAHPGSWYQVVVLDGSVAPAQPLHAIEGWNELGGTGTGWASAYTVLAEHYPWLAGVADTRNHNGTYSNESGAVGAPADGRGSLTAMFFTRPGRPIRRVDDLVAAVFLEDSDGTVRWAKRLPLSAAR